MSKVVEFVKVLPSDPKTSPACIHGPALLFDRVGKQFYACSACRDRKLCPLYVPLGEKRKMRAWENIREGVLPKGDHVAPPEELNKFSRFCEDCCRIVVDPKCRHRCEPISALQLRRPTTFLDQLATNKSTAQYHFSEDTLKFIVTLASRFTKVLCLGTPTVFEEIRLLSNMSSHLADIDRRFEAFFGEESFTWFNMFNAHCFRKGEDSEMWKFASCSETKRERSSSNGCLGEFLVIVDPPFGGLLGPLSCTLRKIVESVRDPKILLVFPYFNEAQVKSHFPDLEMCDYSVRYRNQRKMKTSSPVRLFTDIPLNLIPLPEDEYKFCADCDRWVHKINTHCEKCKACPSKNHEEYRHCDPCARCVKSKWIHCKECNRCHLKEQCGSRRGIERESGKAKSLKQAERRNKKRKLN